TLLAQALANTVSWSGVLHDLSLVIPDQAWITSFTGSISAPSAVTAPGVVPAPTTGPALIGSIQFQGQALDTETLALWLTRLQQARQDAKAVQKQLERLQTEIPPTADLPSLIRLLQGAATAAAVDFMSVSPGQPVAPVAGTGVSTIPTAIQVSGSFFSVEEF